MENWIVGLKFIILLYCVMRFITGDMARMPFVLLSILIYISINMLIYVLKGITCKKIMLVAACLAVVISAYYINPLFILLLPVNLLEIAEMYTEDIKIWAPAALAPVFLCNNTLKPEYILIGLLSLALFVVSFKVYSRIKALRKENELLKEKNDALYRKLDTGREYETQIKYLSQLEERNALAQKIHDKVGHTIAGNLIQLEAASVVLDRDREKAAVIIGNVIRNLKEGMEGIRSTLRNIKPASEQLGINRLKVMLDEFSMRNSIKTALTCNGHMDVISHAQWRIITENIKEALTNTLKYASANAVRVDIEVMNKLIRAGIHDNGDGTLSFKKGLGIAGMEERTENAGGKLIIDSSKGFSIITLLPVNEVDNGNKNINS